ITEVLVLTPEIRTLILERAQEYEITSLAIKQGMRTLRENAIGKLLEGQTSIEEVIRLTM
ncbi:MAG: hypothetical protein PHQ52_06195, partial [Candidatus Omnitrophica bacterium]|nr:hypothetical protein [Candidatus Omnitrophota bacterium]